MITFVWAEDENGAIGLNGHLPWHLPADLHHFKDKTMGHPMLMGRKTFASFPKLLPGRVHVVLTRSADFAREYADNDRVLVLTSQEAMNQWLAANADVEVCAIGGASLFEMLASRADRLERTVIKAAFAADTYMPAIDYGQFDLVAAESHEPDAKNKYPYVFESYQRKH
ncbi:MAG: dihydrofolate reductase [Lactobacillus sp.]|jgi:dihydrofolate reductase|uniref:dihydrofolate reductase n=1 Tax=Lactobacillus sp. 23-2 TaxID=2981842 RepID=UPI002F3B6B51